MQILHLRIYILQSVLWRRTGRAWACETCWPWTATGPIPHSVMQWVRVWTSREGRTRPPFQCTKECLAPHLQTLLGSISLSALKTTHSPFEYNRFSNECSIYLLQLAFVFRLLDTKLMASTQPFKVFEIFELQLGVIVCLAFWFFVCLWAIPGCT